MLSATNQTSYFQEASWADIGVRAAQAFVISLSNAFILLVFYRIKKVTFSNLLFISLSISDLIAGFLALPLAIVSTKFEIWPLGDFMCVVYQILKFAQMRVSNQTVVVLSIHRFFQLFKPFQAEERLDWKKKTAMASCWIFPFTVVVIMITCLYYTNNFKLNGCLLTTPPVFLGAYLILIDVIPSLIAVLVNIYNIYGLYTKFYGSAHSNQISTLKSKFVKAGSAKNESNSPSGSHSTHTAQLSKKHDTTLSNLKTKRDLKAAICILVIILNVIVSEYPLFVTGIVYSFIPTKYYMNIFLTAIKVIYIFPLLNPIILFVFNPNFQAKSIETFKLILRRM